MTREKNNLNQLAKAQNAAGAGAREVELMRIIRFYNRLSPNSKNVGYSMIGKIVTGKSFGGAVEYVLRKEKARLLESDGVDTASVRAITGSFNFQRKARREIVKVVGTFRCRSIGTMRRSLPTSGCGSWRRPIWSVWALPLRSIS